jgi:ADP-heptose:LPS heptosyltransferase
VNDDADLSPLMDDFVMTIDTAVAHLAETLGKPTWLLLSAAHD